MIYVKFFELLVLEILISWLVMSIKRLVFSLPVDQRDVRPIAKQMLVSLNGKVSEDLGVIIPD